MKRRCRTHIYVCVVYISPHLGHPLVVDLRVRERQRRQPGQAREDAAQPHRGRLVLQRDVVAGEAPEGVDKGRAGAPLCVQEGRKNESRIMCSRDPISPCTMPFAHPRTHREHALQPREELVVPWRRGRVEPQAPEGAAALDDEAGEGAEQRNAAFKDREVPRVEDEGVDALWNGVWGVRWALRVDGCETSGCGRNRHDLTSNQLIGLSLSLPGSSARPRCPPAAPPRAGASGARSRPRGRRPRRPAAPATA